MYFVFIAAAAGMIANWAQREEPVAAVKPAEELVVVLPGAGGRVGSVVVERFGERTVVDRAYAGARIRGDGKAEAAPQAAEDVRRDFGSALAALPQRPVSFTLNFVSGRDELTDASRARLDDVLRELRSRPVPDVVVIGHTDTVGPSEANDKLSLQRAERVKGFLVGVGIPADRIQVAGRGERELLVPTADNIAEGQNRRVEIDVR